MTELKFALSIEEAADYTGIGRNTLRNLVEWEKLNEGKDLRDRHAVKAVKGTMKNE